MKPWQFGLSDLIAIIGIAISVFIAVLLYLLTRRVDLTKSLEHRDKVIEILRKKFVSGENKKIEIVNARRFRHDYFEENNKHPIYGYAYLAGELKGVYVDGVEVIEKIERAYKNSDRKYFFKKQNSKDPEVKVLVVGVIPYNQIVFISPDGDDTTNRMQVFVRSRPFNFPYKKYVHYVLNEKDGGQVYERIDIS